MSARNTFINTIVRGYAHRIGFILILLFTVQGLLHSQDTYTSAQSGNWSTASTWTGAAGTPGANDTVFILDGHTVILATGGGESVYSISIEGGGVLDMRNRSFSVSGTFIVDGTVTTNDNTNSDLSFDGSILGGTGTIAIHDNRYFIIASDVVVQSTASLNLNTHVTIQDGTTVTNQGQIRIYGDLDGDNATGSVWTNDTDSELECSGLVMSTGVLNASATGNTVTYIQQGNQSVKTPNISTYYNLVISGTGTKTISDNLIINNDISILFGSLDCGGNSLQIGGNWSNEADFIESTGSVTFNGTADQTLSNDAGEVFYNLTVNKSSGLLNLQSNVQVLNTLTLSAGVIDAGSWMLTLGSGVGSTGTLVYTSGHINGFFERWIDAVGTFSFPVGSLSNQQTIDLTLSGLQSGGSLISRFYNSAPDGTGLPLFDNPDSVFNEFVDGYWSIDEGNGFRLGPANNFDLSLDGNGFSSFTIDGSTRVLIRSDAGSSWNVEGTHLAPVVSVARRSGLSTLPAEFGLGDTTNCSRPLTSAMTGLTEVCTGVTGSSYLVTNNPSNSYTWIITGGSQASGGATNSITVDWGSVGMADGNVRVIEQNSCTQGVPVDLAVTIHTIQPESISGLTSVAENTTGEPYSVTDISGYTYTWTITGGTQASGGTTNSITVDWGSSGTGYVSVVAESATCSTSPATELEVDKYYIIESIATGNWSSTSTWDCGCVPLETDNVRINNTHTVTLTAGQGTEVNIFIIELGGALNPVNRDMTIHGNFILDGSYLSGTRSLTMDGFGTYLDGVGTLDHVITLSANMYIESTAALDVTSGNVIVGDGVSISNYGFLTIEDNLVGSGATSTWVNESNAFLSVGGTLFDGNGILEASSLDNKVQYHGLTAQTIKTPQTSYYNLTVSGSTKSLAGNLDINGDLFLDAAGDLDVVDLVNYSINLAGDWNNLGGGTFNARSGTVIFDGTADQTIHAAETFYNLSFTNASDLYLNGAVVSSNNLSMSGGNIYTQGNILTIGEDAVSPGSLTYTSGIVVGQLERWAATTGTPYLFPIGTATDYRPATITFTNLGSGSVVSEFVASDPGSTGLPLSESTVNVTNQYTEGYWSLTASNGLTSSDYSLQLTATNFSSYTIIPGTRIITRPAGGSWILDGIHAAASDPDLYRNNLTGGISATGTHHGIGHVSCTGLSIDRVITDVSCNGGNDGAIDITLNGGTAPYTFVWGHGPTSEDVSALIAGIYTVDVTDTDGCEIDSTFTVTEPVVLSAVVNSVPVTCTGGNDGSITISSPGGGSGSYDYTINGGTSWQASGSFPNLLSGTYDVRIRDAAVITCIVTLDAALVLTEPNDAIPPVAACQDITVPLDASGNATITTLDIDNGSSDNCSIASMSLDITSFTCADIGPNTVTLTVLDVNGNSNSCTATVTVEDNIAPTFSIPIDITIYSDASCTYDASVGVTGDVTDEADNCSVGDATYLDGVDATDPCNIIITRTWSLVDGSGNPAADQVQTITVQDNTDPTYTGSITASVVEGCSAADVSIAETTVAGLEGLTGDLLIGDNCTLDANLLVSHVDGAPVGTCPISITRTYTITDECGNQVTGITHVITIDDTTDPIASCQDITVQLDPTGNVTIVPGDIDAGSSDNCAITSMSLDITSFDCSNIGPNAVTLTVEDACGLQSTCIATVTVVDNLPPSITCPPNRNEDVDLSDNFTIPDYTVLVTVTDNCNPAPTLTQTPLAGTVISGVGTVQTITITADDGNLNTSQCTFDITLVDPFVLSITCPADIDEYVDNNCDFALLDYTGLALTTGAVSVSQSPAPGFVISGSGTVQTVTLTAFDGGGNSEQCIFDVTLLDDIAPTFTAPANVTIYSDADCAGDASVGNTGNVTDEADNCSVGLNATFLDAIDNTDPCNIIITRTWSLVDGNGNAAIDQDQLITVEDTISPTASDPVAVDVECSGDVPVPDITVVTDEADNCTATPTVAFVSDASDGNTCPEVITRTYSVTDDCLNQILVTQTITVDDNTAPVIAAAPADVAVECIGDLPAMVDLAWTDNCDGSGVVTGTDNTDGNTCPEIITRTWTYTDLCGNAASVSQTITVDDNTAPVIAAAPADVAVECIGDLPAMVDLAWTDNCDGSGVVTGTDNTDGNTCPEIITRTWTYTDLCGNAASVSQTITVDDTTPPTAICQDITVELDVTGNVTIAPGDIDNGSSDNCGIASMWLDITSFDCSNIGPNTVILTVEDACGLQSTCSATVTVEDNLPPSITCPGDISMTAAAGDCSMAVNGIGPVAMVDNCGNNQVTYRLEGATTGTGLDDVSGTDFNKGITTVWYIITDQFSNADSCSFDVTVQTTVIPPDNAFSDPAEVCPGDGNIQLSYSGGVMVEGGMAMWYDDAGLTNNIGNGNSLTIPAPLVTTTYYVRFEGTCDISTAVSTTVTVKSLTIDPVSASVDRANVCSGDGSITLSYTGGSLGSNGSAVWYDDAGFTSSVGTGNNLSVTAPSVTTSYYMRFEADCDTSSAVSVEVTVWPTPEPTFAEMTENACINGPLYRYVASGFAGSVFTWNVTNGTIVNDYNDTIYVDWGDQKVTGTIELTEMSVEGCVSAPVILEVVVGGSDLDLGENVGTCMGTSITIDPEGNFASYLWHDGSTGQDYTTDQEGWIHLEVTDSYGCGTEDSVYVTVHDLPEVDLGPDTSLCGDEELILDAGPDGIVYRWSTGEGGQEIVVHMGGPEEIWVEVENEFGCINGDTVIVASCPIDFYFRDIPTAITPGDGNGLNDFWVIDKLATFSQAVVEIFDRWGNLTWRSEPGYSTPWDGRDMSGKEVPMDSYHFVIDLNTGDNKDVVTGIITVIR